VVVPSVASAVAVESVVSEVLKPVGVDRTAVAVKIQNAAATVTAIASQEDRTVRMPSAAVEAASVMKAGRTAVVGTAAEVNKPHLK